MIRRYFLVRGWVQGVSFRYATQRYAAELALRGWVRNRSDGNVEGVVEGERESVEKLLQFLSRGPSAAKVEGVDITEEPFVDEFTDFTVAPTQR